jgi:hypothetical protein
MATATRRVKVSALKVGDNIRFRLGADESWRTGVVSYVPERFSSTIGGAGKVGVRTEPQPDGYDKAHVTSKHTVEIID